MAAIMRAILIHPHAILTLAFRNNRKLLGNLTDVSQRKHIKYCRDTEVEPEQECLKSDTKCQM